MSDLERRAVQRLIDRATALGVEIPDVVRGIATGHGDMSWPATEWARLHPDADSWCCDGAIHRGADGCTCWVAEYDNIQMAPIPPREPADLVVQKRLCHDCAFLPGSVEREDTYLEEMLLHLAATGEPFWCHEGMRRPARWRHPDGRVIDGSPNDWTPARIGRHPVPSRRLAGPAVCRLGRARSESGARSRNVREIHNFPRT